MAQDSKRLKHNRVGRKKMQATNRVKNPRKQRKRLYNAPAHVRHKLMAAPLSKELVSSRGVKTLPVRKGDTVHIQRGDHKGFEGKISRVDLKNYRIYIEGLTREKVDGTNIFIPVHPSKVMIRNLTLDDNRRKAVVARKKQLEKPAKETKAAAKPAKKVAKAPEKQEPPKIEEAVEVKEEKIVEAPPVVEKAVPEVVKEEAPAEKAPKAPVAKKAVAKRPAAKKPAAKAATAKKAEAKVEEVKAPAKKGAKPKAAAKKAPAKKEAAAKEAAPKTRAKRKTSEGGQ
jgi:large subunit ribosomal protein L24